MSGFAVTGIAARDGRVAVAYWKLNRLAMDGSTGGLPLEGPKTSFNQFDMINGRGGMGMLGSLTPTATLDSGASRDMGMSVGNIPTGSMPTTSSSNSSSSCD